MTGTGAQASTAFFVTNTSDTEWTSGGTIDLIEGDNIPLAVTFTVKGVNADGVETATGTSANISDKIAPHLTSLTVPATGTVDNNVELSFNEDMSEAAAELATNWTISVQPGFTAPAITGAEYASSSVRLTFDNLQWSIVAGTDVCASTLLGDDVRSMTANVATCAQNGTGALLVVADCGGTGAGLCGGAGATGGCCAGTDGLCHAALTAAQIAAGNVPVTTAGVIPICIKPGPNATLQSTAGGTNYILNGMAGIKANAGITDVAGNAVSTTFDEFAISATGVQTGPF